MKPIRILAMFIFILFYSCNIEKSEDEEKNVYSSDSLILLQMVRDRAVAKEKNDIATELSQFSDDATFINGEGLYLANKNEIEKHLNISQDSSKYFEINIDEIKPPTGIVLNKNFKVRYVDIRRYYKIGNVKIRIIDKENALVYYPWRIDACTFPNLNDTIFSEIGLMTLDAQKRNGQWFWIAITNQLTPEYFDDLEIHKRQ